ncbi:MAG TPA: hypothetical protein VK172_09005 [Lentimicrobium sp.]|nr:hypothetical protein [Lentimicrobium sp.]
MKKKVLIFTLGLLFILGLTVNGFAQERGISIDVGGGNTNVNNSFEVVYPFKRYYDAFYQIGARYIYTKANNRITYYTGLTLDKKVLGGGDSKYYLKIPLGIRLNYGNKLKFHIGAGLNHGTYLGSKEYRRFTLGAFINAGPSIHLSEKYRLSLSCQTNFDISPMTREQGHSQAGHASGANYDVRGYDGFLLLSLYRRIK